MIYLITGTPGTGKTAFAVSMILRNKEGLFEYEEDGQKIKRPLYFCHIDGLKERELKAHRLTEEQLQSAPLKELVPTGSVVIVDEADYTYPVRSAGRAVPPYVQTLKELRHEGFTLILMTQHPSMIDIYVRQLVAKHYHLERKFVGTKCYEWFKCVTSLDNPGNVSGGTSSWYKPDKKAFKYYKSATMHVKFKRGAPWILVVLAAIVGVVVWQGSSVYKKQQEAIKAGTETISHAQSGDHVSVSSGTVKSVISIDDYKPRIDGKEETAPLYDEVRKVVDFPKVVGCVKTETGKNEYRCTCYSQQGTPMKVGISFCAAYFNNRPFDPYRQPEQEQYMKQESYQLSSN